MSSRGVVFFIGAGAVGFAAWDTAAGLDGGSNLLARCETDEAGRSCDEFASYLKSGRVVLACCVNPHHRCIVATQKRNRMTDERADDGRGCNVSVAVLFCAEILAAVEQLPRRADLARTRVESATYARARFLRFRRIQRM